jgi:hypothetical protein
MLEKAAQATHTDNSEDAIAHTYRADRDLNGSNF